MIPTRCPPAIHWPDDGLEKDLYVQFRSVTVLAMDGRRRWLDIHNMVGLFPFKKKKLCWAYFKVHTSLI